MRKSKEEVRAEIAASRPHNRENQLLVLGAMRAGVTSRHALARVARTHPMTAWRAQRQLTILGLLRQDRPGGRYLVA